MQNLFAFNQSKESDYYLALKYIDDNFKPEWNTEQERVDQLKKYHDETMVIFRDNYDQESVSLKQPVDQEVKEALFEAKQLYKKQIEADFRNIRKNMIRQAERIYDYYLMILLLLIEFSDLAYREVTEKEKKLAKRGGAVIRNNGDLNLYYNQVINKLRKDTEFQSLVKQKNISWTPYKEQVRNWYREIKVDEEYLKYLNKAKAEFNDDYDLIVYLIKKVVFKNDIITTFFEELDLYWAEDRKIIRSMVMKSLKSIEEDNDGFQLTLLSYNWEEDKEYFEALFEFAVNNQKDHKKILEKKIKNWELDRIATLDYILLQMAMSEMINFPSIPVKVTINEYIEISKNYSTPKSKQFINGVLDVIANELISEGVIKKSGRGLIDNK